MPQNRVAAKLLPYNLVILEERRATSVLDGGETYFLNCCRPLAEIRDILSSSRAGRGAPKPEDEPKSCLAVRSAPRSFQRAALHPG